MFQSRIAQTVAVNSRLIFQVSIVILVLLFAESVRLTIKFSNPVEDETLNHYPEAKAELQKKMFRAHRNMYIAGFALFLNFIIRRLMILMANKAQLMAESEASIKQAQSAAAMAQQLLDERNILDDNSENSTSEKEEEFKEKLTKDDQVLVEKELAHTRVELEKTKEELYKSKLEFESMKKQAQSSCKEYDRLLLEHETLQNKLSAKEGDGNKKEN